MAASYAKTALTDSPFQRIRCSNRFNPSCRFIARLLFSSVMEHSHRQETFAGVGIIRNERLWNRNLSLHFQLKWLVRNLFPDELAGIVVL